MIQFNDGVSFDTKGPAVPVRRSDGWYCVGHSMLISCSNFSEAKQEAERLNKRFGETDESEEEDCDIA